MSVKRELEEEGRMSEAGDVAHRWFYSILLLQHSPQLHPAERKGHVTAKNRARRPTEAVEPGSLTHAGEPELTTCPFAA